MTEPAARDVWSEAAGHFERWRSGDRAAIDDLVRVLTPVLWQVVRAQPLDVAATEDVIQTTWLALVRKPDAIREPAAVGSWLVTTARREAWRVTRAGARVVSVPEEPPLGSVRSAEDEAAQHLRDRELWRLVARLSRRCQRLLRVAAFLDHPDYARLSAELHMPVGSIGPTRGRCLDKLRELLSLEGTTHA